MPSLPRLKASISLVVRMQRISNIDPAILPTSAPKIESALALFDEYARPEPLMKRFDMLEQKLTPSRFLHWMRQEAKANQQRIVLPEASDHRILAAASSAQQKGFAQVVLLGRDAEVRQVRRLRVAYPSHCWRAPAEYVRLTWQGYRLLRRARSHMFCAIPSGPELTACTSQLLAWDAWTSCDT